MKQAILRGLLLVLLLSTSIFVLFSCGDKESPKYELEFFVDGESYNTLTIESNATVEMPTDPSKTGYEFNGWYYDKNIWSKKYNGEAIIDDTTREVFKNVELLRNIGLDVPQASLLAYELRKKGLPIREDVLTVDECTEEIYKLCR